MSISDIIALIFALIVGAGLIYLAFDNLNLKNSK